MTTITHTAGTITPELIDGYQASRTTRSIVHDILNRPNPDITFRPAGLRRGEFRCLFMDQADALSAYAALSVPQVLSISDADVPAIDMSFVIGPEGEQLDIELDDDTRSAWWIVVPFVEVIP
ncbi:hypothetical protein [Microbacterium sp. GbtcB4]|uniref:hypothetical protein n=1 Tax=Microbacterium sp. GbtcB4 TaxID=2824749 RepID=UPI001C2F765C